MKTLGVLARMDVSEELIASILGVVPSSPILASLTRATRLYIPEDLTPHSHSCETSNLTTSTEFSDVKS
jgi:hypothetical protein